MPGEILSMILYRFNSKNVVHFNKSHRLAGKVFTFYGKDCENHWHYSGSGKQDCYRKHEMITSKYGNHLDAIHCK
jgi:hypothetical protein